MDAVNQAINARGKRAIDWIGQRILGIPAEHERRKHRQELFRVSIGFGGGQVGSLCAHAVKSKLYLITTRAPWPTLTPEATRFNGMNLNSSAVRKYEEDLHDAL
jgi:hypothetical protein